MSVLLRQPERFEGILSGSILPHFENPAVSVTVHVDLVDQPIGATAGVWPIARVGMITYSPAGMYSLISIRRSGRRLNHRSAIAKTAGCPRNAPRLRLVRERVPHYCGVQARQPCIKIAAIEGIGRAASDLHVLLRHLPLSVPEAQESA